MEHPAGNIVVHLVEHSEMRKKDRFENEPVAVLCAGYDSEIFRLCKLAAGSESIELVCVRNCREYCAALHNERNTLNPVAAEHIVEHIVSLHYD